MDTRDPIDLAQGVRLTRLTNECMMRPCSSAQVSKSTDSLELPPTCALPHYTQLLTASRSFNILPGGAQKLFGSDLSAATEPRLISLATAIVNNSH